MRETAPVLAQKFEHAAVLYDGTDEYLDAVPSHASVTSKSRAGRQAHLPYPAYRR